MPARGYVGARVDFLFPNGDRRRMAFLSDPDRVLADTRGGELYMTTSAFYKALTKAVSRAEGKPIELLGHKEREQRGEKDRERDRRRESLL